MPFLFRMTDPNAESMLEPFDYDDADPDVNDEATTNTIDWGQAVTREEDILLWSLSSLLDLQELGLGPSENCSIVGPPSSMANLAPVFQPASFTDLETKLGSAVKALKTLHGQLRTHNQGHDEEFDEDLVASVLSAQSVIGFSAVFFKLSHRYISLIHRPSFGSTETSVSLLLAVALAGSMRSTSTERVACARGLGRLLEEYIFGRLEKCMLNTDGAHPGRELLETLQAAVLVHMIHFTNQTAKSCQRVKTDRLPVLVSVARKLGLFATRHGKYTDWVRFIDMESRIRYVSPLRRHSREVSSV